MTTAEASRTALIVGAEGVERLRRSSVIVFGLGGVGSWAAEALARSSVGNICLVDADCVTLSNINRQLPALHSTVGSPKVEVMAERLRDINPDINVVCRCERYTKATADSFPLDDYDFVIDAIDSPSDKAHLILNVTHRTRPTLFSSMGAALRIDPTRVTTAEFWRVDGDPLAAWLRRSFRKRGEFPGRKFTCVFSTEPRRTNQPIDLERDGAMDYGKAATNGSMCPVTATFGMTLAALVINSLVD